jgi:hypothetical protein
VKLKTTKATHISLPVAFYDPERDGVTHSLLTAFKNCRERAKNVLEGWTDNKTSGSITFGNITHELLRRVYEAHRHTPFTDLAEVQEYAADQLDGLEALWKEEHPLADAEDLESLELTMLTLHAVMPLYFRHWRLDFEQKRWEQLESEFKLPTPVQAFVNRQGVRVPVGTPYTTMRRGKMDGAYRAGKRNRIRLFETKTKARVDEAAIGDVLSFEQQVNIYMGALTTLENEHPSGVMYNVIRRPQLRQKKTENLKQFAQRIVDDVKARPDWYFVRLQMDVTKAEIDAAQRDLEGLLLDFLAWWHGHAPHYRNSDHCDGKYGKCPFLKKCASGDTTGLHKRSRVFMELEEM